MFVPKIDLSIFKPRSTPDETRMFYQGLAHAAEAAERYEDMCVFMCEVVKAAKSGSDLTYDERNLLSVSFKNSVGVLRAAWRNLQSASDARNDPIYLNHFRKRVEDELNYYCLTILDLLEQYLINHKLANDDAKIFYYKMAGDYYRYLAEFKPDDADLRNKSVDNYASAMALAEVLMKPCDPVRLGLALNYSVCLYEIIKSHDKAIELAESSFKAALDTTSFNAEHHLKDSYLILQLLRDNLQLWKNFGEEGV